MTTTAPVTWDVFLKLKETKPSLLFYVSREPDDVLYVYTANRQGDKLEPPYVDITTCNLSNVEGTTEPITTFLKDKFFGMTVPASDITNCSMISIPNRRLKMCLKKEKHRVTMTTTAFSQFTNNGKVYDVSLDNAEIYNVHMFVTYNAVGIPDVTKLHINVRAPFKEIKIPDPILCSAKPNDAFYFTEVVHVTPEMKANFNAVQLFKQFSALSVNETKEQKTKDKTD